MPYKCPVSKICTIIIFGQNWTFSCFRIVGRDLLWRSASDFIQGFTLVVNLCIFPSSLQYTSSHLTSYFRRETLLMFRLWMSLLNISQQICKSQFDLIHVTHTHGDMRLSTSWGLFVARGVVQLIFNPPSSVLSSEEYSFHCLICFLPSVHLFFFLFFAFSNRSTATG